MPVHKKPSRNLPGASADGAGLEVLYGLHTVAAALANPARTVKAVVATRNAANRLAAMFDPAPCPAAITTAHPRELQKLAGPDAVHQGLVAQVTALPDVHLDEIAATGIVLVLDQITDPHNVGAIVRSAAAFGAGAIVVTSRHSPGSAGITAKAASGGLEHVPVVTVGNLARAMEALHRRNFTLVGLDSDADSDISTLALRQPVALVLGAEGKGLRRLTRDNCDFLARLDLPGKIKSLNVSNAAVLALGAVHAKLVPGAQ